MATGWRALTKAEHLAQGYKPSARKHYDPEGNVRPYRAYLDAKAQETLEVPSERVAAKIRKEAKAEGAPKRLLQVFRDAFFDEYGEKIAAPDPRPGGRLARYLEAEGRRPAGADYAVGETPDKDKR